MVTWGHEVLLFTSVRNALGRNCVTVCLCDCEAMDLLNVLSVCVCEIRCVFSIKNVLAQFLPS